MRTTNQISRICDSLGAAPLAKVTNTERHVGFFFFFWRKVNKSTFQLQGHVALLRSLSVTVWQSCVVLTGVFGSAGGVGWGHTIQMTTTNINDDSNMIPFWQLRFHPPENSTQVNDIMIIIHQAQDQDVHTTQ